MKQIFKSFIGKKQEVDKQVEKYFREYPPAGYQTRIIKDVILGKARQVEIIHYDSCD